MLKGAALKANNLDLGLITFMTFTCAPEDRERIARGELMLGREMKRTLNAMQQRFRREGYADFVYIWVAENPRESNPHVHLLTNHRVRRCDFGGFAAWVESLWGHGWVKIEGIRDPACAGHYLLKAVGYTLKGGGGSQGTVRGNRYGISKNIRTVDMTKDVRDREAAAQTLLALTRALPKGSDIEPLGASAYLTRYGLAFSAGTSVEQLYRVIDELQQGALPG